MVLVIMKKIFIMILKLETKFLLMVMDVKFSYNTYWKFDFEK